MFPSFRQGPRIFLRESVGFFRFVDPLDEGAVRGFVLLFWPLKRPPCRWSTLKKSPLKTAFCSSVRCVEAAACFFSDWPQRGARGEPRRPPCVAVSKKGRRATRSKVGGGCGESPPGHRGSPGASARQRSRASIRRGSGGPIGRRLWGSSALLYSPSRTGSLPPPTQVGPRRPPRRAADRFRGPSSVPPAECRRVLPAMDLP